MFTDILENPEAPKATLQPIYDRLGLASLGTQKLYEGVLEKNGMKMVKSYTETKNMERHYGMVKYSAQVLKNTELRKVVADEFIEKQVRGLGHWIDAANKHHIEWGWFAFKK